jgi:hypothetical protein
MENQIEKTENNKLMVAKMFEDRESAERAYSSLHERGYKKDDINVIMTDEARKKHFGNTEHATDLSSKALEGLGAGSAIGATLGAVAGIIAAIGTNLVLPGLGLVIAGPIAAGLAGAGAGSITGGIIGSLVGAGIPEEHAKHYEQGLKKGNILLGVHPHEHDTLTASEWEKVHEYKDNSGTV